MSILEKRARHQTKKPTTFYLTYSGIVRWICILLSETERQGAFGGTLFREVAACDRPRWYRGALSAKLPATPTGPKWSAAGHTHESKIAKCVVCSLSERDNNACVCVGCIFDFSSAPESVRLQRQGTKASRSLSLPWCPNLRLCPDPKLSKHACVSVYAG